MKSFLYAWDHQNYVLMFINKCGLSFCLQKGTSTHCLDCLLPCPFMKTMSILPKLGKGQKLECKGFTYKDFKYTPVYWDRCQAKSGKLMFVAN